MNSLKCLAAVFALVAGAVMAAPAQAGLDFTDRAVSSGGTADFTFNGSSVVGTTVAMNNGFGGAATSATLTSTNAPGSITPTLGVVEFSYNGLFNGVVAANYDRAPGNPAYTMAIEFGALSFGSAFVTLQSIEFKDAVTGYNGIYNVNQSLTGLASNSRLLIFVPTGVGGIALADRDAVQTVRLSFLFTGGSSTSINVKAVANPEPGTIALFGLGALGLVGAVRARRKKSVVAAKSNA